MIQKKYWGNTFLILESNINVIIRLFSDIWKEQFIDFILYFVLSVFHKFVSDNILFNKAHTIKDRR